MQLSSHEPWVAISALWLRLNERLVRFPGRTTLASRLKHASLIIRNERGSRTGLRRKRISPEAVLG